MKYLLISLLFVSAFADAQVTYFDNPESMADFSRGQEHRKFVRDNHIRSEKLYQYKTQADADAGRNGYLYQEQSYDADGNMTDYKYYKRNGKLKYQYTYKWDSQGRITEFQWLKRNGVMVLKNFTTYNDAGKVVEEKQYIKHDKDLAWHSTSTYDSNQNITELKYLLNNDRKLYRRYEYSYYPDKSKKQTVEYNRKGKIKHKWNYDCNPAGALEAKAFKDSSKICIRFETDKDGNPIKIKEHNVKQGSTVRIVSKYDKNDNEIFSASYNASGKETRHTENTYDAKNNITERKVFKPNTSMLKNRYVFQYDATGNMVQSISYKGAKLTHVFKHVYNS